MTTSRTDSNTAPHTLAPQSVAHTFVVPHGARVDACGGNCSTEARNHAVALSQEITHYGQSIAAMARKSIPAGLFTAVATAMASVDVASAGMAVGAMAMAGTVSAVTHSNGKDKSTRSV